jgi:hypothetical protein
MRAMRLLGLVVAVPVALIVMIMLGNGPFQPAPASTRLAGVSVAVIGFTVTDLGNSHLRLTLGIRVTSIRDLDACLGFALDEPFGNRKISDPPTGCIKPLAAPATAQLTFDGLTDDDLTFPYHTLVWGIPGGRCGLIMTVMRMCVIEQAGTVPVAVADAFARCHLRPIRDVRAALHAPAGVPLAEVASHRVHVAQLLYAREHLRELSDR